MRTSIKSILSQSCRPEPHQRPRSPRAHPALSLTARAPHTGSFRCEPRDPVLPTAYEHARAPAVHPLSSAVLCACPGTQTDSTAPRSRTCSFVTMSRTLATRPAGTPIWSSTRGTSSHVRALVQATIAVLDLDIPRNTVVVFRERCTRQVGPTDRAHQPLVHRICICADGHVVRGRVGCGTRCGRARVRASWHDPRNGRA